MDSINIVPTSVGIARGERQPAKRLMIDAVARIAKPLIAARQRSRQRRALAAFSDHLLYDIGLTHGDFARRTCRWQPRM